MEEERKQREEMERVREELYLEEQEEANRQRDIVRIKPFQQELYDLCRSVKFEYTFTLLH